MVSSTKASLLLFIVSVGEVMVSRALQAFIYTTAGNGGVPFSGVAVLPAISGFPGAIGRFLHIIFG